MKLPRNLSGADLAKALKKLGYVVTRQKSSHIRMTTQQNGQHHVTIPDHDPVKVGTLADILKDVADHFGLQRDELLDQLFG
jgi:predicted RNA binding protein YcfA (HicA-like mRNA interferase family)